MAFFVAREGVWDVVAGDTSGTPTLTVNGLRAGTHVKITVNFSASTALANSNEGFYYSIAANGTNDVLAMTPATGIVQGNEGWQSSVLITIFEVLVTTDGETTFDCTFSKGDLSGTGSLMNFVMLAEII